jgi:hypothetical protein
MTELSEAVSKKKDRIMVITKMVLNEIKWLLEFIGRSKSYHLMKMAFGGDAMSSQRHIANPMRRSSFQIINFIGLTASREEKAFSITMLTYAICAKRILDKGETYS